MRNFGPVFSLALLVTGWAARALALTAEVPTRDPSLVGQAFTFRAVTSGAVGVTQYRWNFGDGPAGDFVADASEVQHTYAQPGHYSIIVTIKDQAGFTSVAFGHTVHYPVKARRPSASTDIVYDQARHRIYTTNEDDDSITVIDAAGLKKVAEIPVYQRPEALALTPEGKLWVVHRDDYAVAVVDLDGLAVERGFRLPYASQPMGLAMSPTGDAAYITLMAVGKLLKLNPSTGDAIGAVAVGPWPRGVSVSEDGRDVYVTRFISADAHGEVVQVDGPMLKVVKRIELAADTTTADSDQSAAVFATVSSSTRTTRFDRRSPFSTWRKASSSASSGSTWTIATSLPTSSSVRSAISCSSPRLGQGSSRCTTRIRRAS